MTMWEGFKVAMGAIGAWVFICVLFYIFALALLTSSTFLDWLKQRRCEHLHYRETRSCDAVCNRCNKNLGFIEHLRDRDRVAGRRPSA